MTKVKLFTLHLDAHEEEAHKEEAYWLQKRLFTWNIKFEQCIDRPGIAMTNEYGKEFAWSEIQTRDQLFKALHEKPPKPNPKPDPEPVINEEAHVNDIVKQLIEKGEPGIKEYMSSLDQNNQIQFVVGARLQRHYDAHMIIEAGEMIKDMLNLKARGLDPWIK